MSSAAADLKIAPALVVVPMCYRHFTAQNIAGARHEQSHNVKNLDLHLFFVRLWQLIQGLACQFGSCDG